MSQAIDFESRVLDLMVKRFPLTLAWLTCQPADIRCDRRRDVASQLLLARTMSQLDDDATTFNLRLLFEKELMETVSTGILNQDLWQLVWDFSRCLWTIHKMWNA